MELHRTPLYRLPKHVIPVQYKICLKPCFDTFKKFDGNLECRIKIDEKCNEILMHCVKLNLKDVEFKTDSGKIIKVEKVLHDEEKEIVKLFFGQKDALPTGMGTLIIKYEGEISDRELKGIYCNRWNETERDMKDKSWIMTKLDGCQARLALPCFDEPEFKATFKMELDIPNEMDCLFNSIKEKEESIIQGNRKKIHFKETPMMSTSSLAFCIGKFDRAFEQDIDGTKLRICLPKSKDEFKRKKEWAIWTVDIAGKLLKFFKDNFGREQCRYPLDKLDLLVVPNYAVRGTGHFGLIGIREDRFWANENSSPCTKKQRVALLLAKLIAKQWFGNMVNIKEWKQIWLEESLCKFLKYYAVDKLRPEWFVWEQEFTREELMPAMRFDMLSTTDPMEITDDMVKTWLGKTSLECLEHLKAGDWDYLEKFVRFSKGAAVLRMLKDHVGEQNFNKALFKFLNKNCFKHAAPEDLWNEMELEGKKPIKQMMKTWSEKKAFPIIHVTGKLDPTGNFTITMKQESVLKHLKDLPATYGKMETHHRFDERDEPKFWAIPLTITTDPSGMQPKMEVMMDKEMISLMVPAAEYRNANGYFKIDPRHTCYTTVCYPEDYMRKVMMPMIERREMRDPMDRFGLLFDVKKLCKINLHSTSLLLDLIKTICDGGREDNFTVWRMVTECMWELRQMCLDYDHYKGRDEFRTKLNRFAQNLIKDRKGLIGDDRWWAQSKMDKMTSTNEMLIGLLAHFAVVFKDEDIERKAVDTFWKWYRHEHEQGNKIVMGDMQKALFAAAAQTNDMKACDAFMKIYKEYKFEEAREFVLHGIGFFTDKMIIDKLTEFALSDMVASEDTLRMLKSMSRRFPLTRDMMWKLLQDKHDFFMKNYDRCRFGTDFFEEFVTNFCDDKMAMDICKFAQSKIQMKHCTRMLQQSMEYVQLKSNWFKRDGEIIKKCLDKI